MVNVIIIKTLLNAWQTLGFYIVHDGSTEATMGASYWYGAKNVFFYVDFRFGAPLYRVNFSYWDSKRKAVRGYDYATKDLHRALKKAYVFQNLVKALDAKS